MCHFLLKCTAATSLWLQKSERFCVFASVRLEAAKDDYRIHCEELEKQLIEVQHRNDELTSLAEESRALKDELDVLRFVSVWGSALIRSGEVFSPECRPQK